MYSAFGTFHCNFQCIKFLVCHLFPLHFGNDLNSSGHLRSTHDSIINHVGIPSCFTIATTSYINFCQWDGVPGICLKNKLGLEKLDFVSLMDSILIERQWQNDHEPFSMQYWYYPKLFSAQLRIVQRKDTLGF